jgi:hypothetical protein
MPNGTVLTSTHTALLDLPQLPLAARQAHIFQDLQCALVSIGQFCDNGFDAHFNKTHVRILRDNIVHLEGQRNLSNGLWNLPLRHVPPEPSAPTM